MILLHFRCCSKFAPTWFQEGTHGPKKAQVGPNRAQVGLKLGPRWPQEGPKRAPRGPQEGPKRAPRGPKKAQEATRGPQENPRGPKRAPRGPKRAPKRTPRGPQEGPKRAPGRAQESSWGCWGLGLLGFWGLGVWGGRRHRPKARKFSLPSVEPLLLTSVWPTRMVSSASLVPVAVVTAAVTLPEPSPQ